MQCRACPKSNLTISQMKKEKGVVNRGICLQCASESASLAIMRSRVALQPHLYMECNDCDKYFKRNSSGRFPRLRVECPYCSSKNFQKVE